ncbi:MAG: Na+/H+ antiporter NhaC family protein [Planctomycetota bacterium]
MRTKTLIKNTGAGVFFIGVCALAICFTPDAKQGLPEVHWYSIIPPLLAILLAFLTRHIMLSLGTAIVVGGFLSTVPQAPFSGTAWWGGAKTAGVYVADTISNQTNLQILAFVPPIFALVVVVEASGGFNGLIRWLLKWIKGRKSAQAATAFLGTLYFIDDYSNTMIVGSMMRSVTDRFRVSREKLAFLVDATSAPICGLAVISTWIAYEVGLFTEVAQRLGIDQNGYSMFFDALCFRFYCVLMIFFVFLHVLLARDFGPMKRAEELMKVNGRVPEASGPSSNAGSGVKGRAASALIPLAGLVIFHIVGLWFDGGGPGKLGDVGSLYSWVYWREVIGNADSSIFVLDCAASFGLLLAIVCARLFEAVSFSVILRCLWLGLKRSVIPCTILVLAWSIKNCCDGLKTGEFLTSVLAEKCSPQWFGPLLFLVASLTSFATGTSWGTMAILIPVAVPIAFALDGNSYGLTTMISLGAVLDGAIFGDHCSPISDTTILSSTASGCPLMRHVRTQLPYSLFVAFLALTCGYLISSSGIKTRWCLLLGVSVMTCLLVAITWRQRTKNSSAAALEFPHQGTG